MIICEVERSIAEFIIVDGSFKGLDARVTHFEKGYGPIEQLQSDKDIDRDRN